MDRPPWLQRSSWLKSVNARSGVTCMLSYIDSPGIKGPILHCAERCFNRIM